MTTLGSYFAMRLEQLGVEHYFMVPSEISPPFENKNLKPIFCCNALNASFAADGYARARKVGVVVTSSLSALEALVDTSLPLIVISERSMMQEDSVTIHTLEEAPLQLDEALEMALTDHKAVYIEIAYSLFEETVLSEPQGILKDRTPPSNKESLQAAVEHAVHFLKDAERTTLVAGSKLRSWGGKQPFRTLADISGFPVAIQPDAKGVFPEDHPQYVGTLTQNLLDTSDAYLFIGTHLENALIKPERTKLIDVNTHSVQVCEQLYTDVLIANFLDALQKKIRRSKLKVHKKQKEKRKKIDGETPLNLPHIFRELERALDSDMALLVDGWFNYEELQLPEGCFFEVHNTQISWSVGAALGYQLALQGKKRLIACISAPSLQRGVQEISTMIRYNLNPLILVLNSYEDHELKNWHYARLPDVFNGIDGKGWGWRAKSCQEFSDIFRVALKHDDVSLLELVIDQTDASQELLRPVKIKNKGETP